MAKLSRKLIEPDVPAPMSTLSRSALSVNAASPTRRLAMPPSAALPAADAGATHRSCPRPVSDELPAIEPALTSYVALDTYTPPPYWLALLFSIVPAIAPCAYPTTATPPPSEATLRSTSESLRTESEPSLVTRTPPPLLEASLPITEPATSTDEPEANTPPPLMALFPCTRLPASAVNALEPCSRMPPPDALAVLPSTLDPPDSVNVEAANNVR